MIDSIVVTGYGMVTPLGWDTETTWKSLFENKNAIAALKGQEWKGFEEPRAAQVMDAFGSEKLIRRGRSLRRGVAGAQAGGGEHPPDRVPQERIGPTPAPPHGARP